MITRLSHAQYVALSRLSVHPDGKAFIDILKDERQATLEKIEAATLETIQLLQGQARTLRELIEQFEKSDELSKRKP